MWLLLLGTVAAFLIFRFIMLLRAGIRIPTSSHIHLSDDLP
jgi:hypothetical protein